LTPILKSVGIQDRILSKLECLAPLFIPSLSQFDDFVQLERIFMPRTYR
jgi:hypothetical protein